MEDFIKTSNKILRNKYQAEAFNDKSRFKFLLCGRRSGKSYLITEDIVKTAHSMPSHSELVYFAPTNQMSMELIWEPLEYRLDKLGWSYIPKVSKQRFELSRKRKIYVLGLERHRRIRGHAVAKVYLDEVAFYDGDLNRAWRAIRPTLTDLKGGAIFSTTPNGKGSPCYEFYLETIGKPGWKFFHWTSFQNPFIDKSEIEEAQNELDAKSFQQEYEASWENFNGLAYWSFDEKLNIKNTAPIDYSLPLTLTFDFNVNPTTLLLSQWHHDGMHYKKEYSFKNSSTEDTVKAFCEDFKKQASNVRIQIRGDAAGSSRSSNTGRSDYDYICEILTYSGFSFDKQVLSHNPPIVDRVKKVNAYLKNFLGVPRIFINPACVDTIKDLSSQEVIGRIPNEKGNLGHKASALGYDIYYQDRIQKITPVASRIL